MCLTGRVKSKAVQKSHLAADGSQILRIQKALKNTQDLRLGASKNSVLEKLGY